MLKKPPAARGEGNKIKIIKNKNINIFKIKIMLNYKHDFGWILKPSNLFISLWLLIYSWKPFRFQYFVIFSWKSKKWLSISRGWTYNHIIFLIYFYSFILCFRASWPQNIFLFIFYIFFLISENAQESRGWAL